MVWVDDSGRMQLCEATVSGFLVTPPIKPCFATISGFVIEEKKE
jgi:hypothetical protein